MPHNREFHHHHWNHYFPTNGSVTANKIKYSYCYNFKRRRRQRILAASQKRDLIFEGNKEIVQDFLTVSNNRAGEAEGELSKKK